MALTRTLPIKNRVFTAETLGELLRDISSHYRKTKEPYRENSYRLQISENETTTISLDSPPKKFDSLLSTSVRYLSLRIDSISPSRTLELTLYHGQDSILNSIRLHSDDEDWVNLAYAKLSKALDNTAMQSTFLRRYGPWIWLPLALLIGWPLKSLWFRIMLSLGEAKLVPWSLSLFFKHLLIAGVLGFLPAALLLLYAENAFPSVEIQTGPNRNWREARRRNWLRFVFALVVVGPLANFLYDLYKFLFLG